MARISIVVPVYNVEQYLEKCLQSIVNQTMNDIEILIIDDGSPDESYKIYDRFALNDSRIRIIKKQNAGVSEARNTGIENATGDFIMFADSDDWMELNCCEEMNKEQLRTDADMILADVYVVTNGKSEYYHIFEKPFVTEDLQFIKQYQKTCIGYSYNPLPAGKWKTPGMGSPWNKLFSMKIIRENNLRFDPYVKGIYDDNLFTLHYLMHVKKLAYIQVPVYDFRLVQGSLTQSYKANTLDINNRIFERINDFIDEMDERDFFEEAFYVYVIRRLSKSLNVYFFAENNRDSLNSKCKKYTMTISEDPYRKAIKNVKLNKLLFNHKIVCLLSKMKASYLIYIIILLKRAFGR